MVLFRWLYASHDNRTISTVVKRNENNSKKHKPNIYKNAKHTIFRAIYIQIDI